MIEGKRFFHRLFSGDGFYLHRPENGASEVYAVRQLAGGEWSLLGGNELTAAAGRTAGFSERAGKFLFGFHKVRRGGHH